MSGFKVNFSVNNQLATPSMHAAALANRPAAGQPGRVFIDTDNPSTGIYRDTGTVWVQIAETSTSDVDTLQNVTDNGNTTDNSLILTYNSLFNGSNQIEFFDVGTTATRYSINKVGTGNRLTIQGNSPLSTNDMGLMIDAPNNTLRTYWGSSFNTRGISCDFTNNIYRLGNISGAVGSQGIYVDANGNVGIGTTTPLSVAGFNTLTVNGTSGSIFSAQFNGTDSFRITTGPASTFIVETRALPIQIGTNNTERVRILSNGNVGIGTASPGSIFEVYGSNPAITINSQGTNTTLLAVASNAGSYSTDAAAGDFVIRANNKRILLNTDATSAALIMHTTKNITVGSNTDAGFRLDVNGTARFTGNVGIGMGSGLNALQVRGNFYADDGNGYYGVINATNGGWFISNQGNSAARISSTFTYFLSNTAIGTSTDISSAILSATSTTKGFLPPRMTTAQINAISSPAEGLIAYNTTISHLCVYQSGAWVRINHSPM